MDNKLANFSAALNLDQFAPPSETGKGTEGVDDISLVFETPVAAQKPTSIRFAEPKSEMELDPVSFAEKLSSNDGVFLL